uniref:Uncharacterized protein n=1 Tax=Anguilla anguilla TaxID=7936 RepID=A0A0E9XAL4_ANGAN
MTGLQVQRYSWIQFQAQRTLMRVYMLMSTLAWIEQHPVTGQQKLRALLEESICTGRYHWSLSLCGSSL